MAHSVEGRFPFLDPNVVTLADSLPAAYKLKVLDEKHVLKRASLGLVPAEILQRKKQPYRAPDAVSFVAADAPAWIDEALSQRAVKDAGVFDPLPIAQLWHKCKSRKDEAQFSNADNMAVVGVLSTQLLHAAFIARCPSPPKTVTLKTLIEKAP
jgi:asparagine synthase (glutamine-hydrolysing)